MFCYTFKNIPCGERESYYFQKTDGRILSPLLHTHDFYELFSVFSGRCTAEVNGLAYRLSPGETVFLAPGHSHRFTSQEDGTDLFSVSVKREEFDTLRRLFAPDLSFSEPILLLAEDGFCDFSLRFFPGAEAAAGGGIDEKRLFLATLLSRLSRTVKKNTVHSSAIVSSLEGALASDPSALARGMRAMVAVSGYSRSHLSRLILSASGETAGQFLRRLRLDYAYRAIISGNAPFENIAESVGFSSYSHFHRIFTAKYGISPAALRKGTPGTTV